MNVVFYLIAASFLVEALTQLIQKSVFFSAFRASFKEDTFFNTLLECPYCTSVWISMFVTLCVVLSGFNLVFFGNLVFDIFVFFVGCHRFSNLIHDVWDRYLSRHYKRGL